MSKKNRTTLDRITYRVTAPAGLCLPGFGSREWGETYTVTVDEAVRLDDVEGLDYVQPGDDSPAAPPEQPEEE